MVPELEKPRITEIHVRMDCNGCVQKIKRALHGINGIYDLYIDFPNQKLTIVGWADPEKIVKAIKKTRKTATICSHTEPPDPAAKPPDQPLDGDAPPSDAANSPQQEAPPGEQPKDNPVPENPPPAPENPNLQPEPDKREGQHQQDGQPPPPPPPSGQAPAGPKDVGEVHVVYHHPPPPEYGYRYWYGRNFDGDRCYGGYTRGYEFQQEPPPAPLQQPPPIQQSTPLQPPTPMQQSVPLQQTQQSVPLQQAQQPRPTHVTHSYNTYKPSPSTPLQPPTPMQQSVPLQPPTLPQQSVSLQQQPLPPQPQPIYVTHSYNTYKPSPYMTEYHDYSRPPQPPPPPQPQYRYYSPARAEQYANQEYSYSYPHHHQGGSTGPSNGNIMSFFSDENPNACRIM